MVEMSDMVAGGYYASTALFGIGGAGFALATRDRLYAYFALHALAVGALALTFPPVSPAADAILPWHIACRIAAEGLVVATIGLGIAHLLAPRLSGLLGYAIRCVFPIGLMASASSLWFLFNIEASYIYALVMLGVLVTIAVALVVGIARGHRETLWIAVALAPLLSVGVIAAVMDGFELGSMQNYAEGMLLGFAFELVCVSGLLAVRFRSTLRERDAALAEAVAARNASEVDALTGIANRRVFERDLRNIPHESYTALAIVDCDHFKRINDQFGHATGDVVLQSIARSLDCVPGKAMRIGGEEFAVFLTAPDWQRELELLREGIAHQTRHALAGLEIVQNVTVSIGAVELSQGRPTEQALMLADEALYRAKRLGRNRLEIERPYEAKPKISPAIACAA
ncbi:diguanylate cyclase [Erythrobacter sp.]|uniref:GGDEF domain-containing protein n=1 Tax=Erythrobacter sp. TaxID=1042 RepID=UPI0025DD1D73|nr:GGDEF domain-containing protein [Erythrobacter sp.]